MSISRSWPTSPSRSKKPAPRDPLHLHHRPHLPDPLSRHGLGDLPEGWAVVSLPNPEQILFDAFRPHMFPAQAAHEAHVGITALRAAGMLKEPTACECGPTEDEKAFAETGERIAAMSDEAFNKLYEELWEKGEGGV
jgi:hypothetical protein